MTYTNCTASVDAEALRHKLSCDWVEPNGKVRLYIGYDLLIWLESDELAVQIRDCIDAYLKSKADAMATPPVRDAASVPSFPAREGCAS